MAAGIPETSIVIGATDVSKYVGITTPITAVEASAIDWSTVVDVGMTLRDVAEPDPACTLLGVGNDTERAQQVAETLAHRLGQIRQGAVLYDPNPIDMGDGIFVTP